MANWNLRLVPSPSLLRLFSEARSQVEVMEISGVERSVLYRHLCRAKSMGLVEELTEKRESRRGGPKMKLLRLTDRGRRYVKYMQYETGEKS